MELKIKALSPKIGTEIPLPRFATAGAACMDLCACIDEAVTLAAGERRLVPTGIAIALPSADYAALVFARSGLGIKKGVCLSNGVGVIDSDYRGELRVPMVNLSNEPYTIQPGERVVTVLVFQTGLQAPARQFGTDKVGQRFQHACIVNAGGGICNAQQAAAERVRQRRK